MKDYHARRTDGRQVMTKAYMAFHQLHLIKTYFWNLSSRNDFYSFF